MEAKAACLPSVSFPSGELPKMIEHRVDGFIVGTKASKRLPRHSISYRSPLQTPRHGAAAKASLRRLGVEDFSDRWLAIYERTT